MSRNLFFYLLMLLVFVSLIAYVINKGEETYPKTNIALSTVKNSSENIQPSPSQNIGENHEGSSISVMCEQFKDKFSHPMSILILQIIVIIIVARIFGFLFGKIGQPTVIGEIIAGIILGPSLLGNLFPQISLFLFRPESLKNLEILSQFGLVLFMFIIGMEIDTKFVRKKINSAVIISYTGIIFPYFLGIVLSYFIYSSFAMPSVTFTTFALFIGIAMSITAFPVLARIIHEKGLTRTPLGIMAITCAATDDITAWLIFAAIIAIAQAGSALSAVFVIVIAIIFVISMLFIVQPILKRIGSIYVSNENLSKTVMAFIFLILFCSAFFTEMIGIHALFGAFIAGVVVPKNQVLKKLMINKIEDISTVVLLPLFFAFSGLRTQIGLLNTPYLWAVCGIVILIAVIGKLGGIAIAARFMGNSWKYSISMGVLMNTRGLMELIVLNIGYDLGILSPEIFSIMVIMALTTTFMSGPLLNFVEKYKTKANVSSDNHDDLSLNVLISFAIPKMGNSLLKIVNAISGKEKTNNISALHLTPYTEITQSAAIKYESNSFASIRHLAKELNVELNTIYKTTEDVTKEILKTTNKGKYNLLLIGAAKSIFNKNALGGKVKNIIDRANCTVGVFIEKDFHKINHVLVLSDNINSEKLNNFCGRLLINSGCNIVFMSPDGDILPGLKLQNERIKYIVYKEEIEPAFLDKFDLMITNIDNFERTLSENSIMLDSAPSLLLLNFTDDIF